MPTLRLRPGLTALAVSLLIAATSAQTGSLGSSVPAPSTEQFARLCATTEDLADCGKKIEAIQIGKAGEFIRRDGNLLAIKVPGELPYLFEDIPGEAGPNYSFYAWHAPSESIILFRSKEDKLNFVLLHLPTGGQTILPNEPLFNSDGRYFVTIDFCSDGCENRLTLWRFERNGPARERYFRPRATWTDAGVSWGAPRRLIIDYTEKGKNASVNLELNDPRWTVLLP